MIKIPTSCTLLICALLLFTTTGLRAQRDEQLILKAREASNKALKNYEHERVLHFDGRCSDHYGNGTLLAGKESLRTYIRDAGPSTMYWGSQHGQIKVNRERGLAWESGTWKGYDPQQGDQPVIGGKYSAMWTQASGSWRIKSQLFVTLE